MFGVRPEHTFRAAATKFLSENQHKRSIDDDAIHLAQLDPFIGAMSLRAVDIDSLQPFIASRRADGVKTTTINLALGTVRRILNLAASEWRDDQHRMTWLEHAPKIKLLQVTDKRRPYPLSREEQSALLQEQPDYLARMSLFKANTGLREKEVCSLKWADEVKVPELDTSVFIIDGDKIKNGQDRLVVLNSVARSVIESVRGQHPVHVFVRFPKPNKASPDEASRKCNPVHVPRMHTTAWNSARERAADKWRERTGEEALEGFRRVRVHDLKHTFGRRLRAVGVSFEDRQDLLGHKSSRITTDYSAPELANLIAAAEKVCESGSRKSPASTWLRKTVGLVERR